MGDLGFKRFWYKFSRSPGSFIGSGIILMILILTIFADFIAPYPEQAGAYVNLKDSLKPPSKDHIFGIDEMGRDVFTRTIYGYRLSLMLAAVVLSVSVPFGISLGLVAGYLGRRFETGLMILTDISLPLPPLVMALAIGAALKPSIYQVMIALSVLWWTWYAKLLHNMAVSIRNEEYIQAAEILGMSKLRVVFSEILPNCWSTILVKVTLDIGFVVLLGAGLSFLGLGVRPPKPGLGTMIAAGLTYIPECWWISVFPAIALVALIFGVNLLADSLRDSFEITD